MKPENDATSIRVLSPGNGGDVTQSNDATAIAAALNGNETKQSIDQSQGGSGRSGSGDATQIAGQSAASNSQSADADAKAVQVKREQLGHVDPRAEPGQRRRRHAVELREGHRPRGERQRDEAVDRPDAGRLGPAARRRSRGRRRRTTRTPTRMRRPFSGSRATLPRRSASSARARAATSRSRTTLSRSARR